MGWKCGQNHTGQKSSLAWLAKENKLFDEVAVAEVTETPDNKKIQEKDQEYNA